MKFKQPLIFIPLLVSSTQLIANEEAHPVIKWFSEAEYELDLSVIGYFHKPTSAEANQDVAAFLGRFSMQSTTWFNDQWALGFKLYTSYSSQSDGYTGTFGSFSHPNNKSSYVDFETLWVRYEHDDFSLLLGKEYIETGLAELYSPLDRFALVNFFNPSQPYDMGVWQAAIDYFIEDDTLSFKVLPIYNQALFPGASSRWIGDTNDPQFTQIAQTYTIEDDYREIKFSHVSYLLQYKGSRAGYDFSALVHYGVALYPTLQFGELPNQRRKIEPLATSVAFSVLKVIDQWTLYGEAIYQHSNDHQDDNFIRYALGASYVEYSLANFLNLDQIKTTVQWSGDETVDQADSRIVDASSRYARPFRGSVLTRIEFEHNSKWRSLLSSAYNLESDYALLAAVEYRPTDNLSLNLEAAFFDGDSDTFFGRWKDNDYLKFRAIYKF
ncbi:MAG: hypothetical protein GQ582_01710 [Methyloprofundus sp.]|nr:hypothetical protein [Methyloprofundus sp.]